MLSINSRSNNDASLASDFWASYIKRTCENVSMGYVNTFIGMHCI